MKKTRQRTNQRRPPDFVLLPESLLPYVQPALSKATSENQWMNDPQAEPAWLETS
jgi:apolipoprotein N-acyltransferase